MLHWPPTVMVAVSAVSTEAHRVLAQLGPAERPAVLAPATEVVRALGPGLPHSGHSQGAELRASGRVHTGTHVCRVGVPTRAHTSVEWVCPHSCVHTSVEWACPHSCTHICRMGVPTLMWTHVCRVGVPTLVHILVCTHIYRVGMHTRL